MARGNHPPVGGVVYHVLNRANGGATLFEKPNDYAAFECILLEAHERHPVSVFAYCVMPNHWHMVLQPRTDPQLGSFVHWLTVTHAKRWHAWHGTSGSGHVYQGTYKRFPVQTDSHYLVVCRYVERNPLRANLVGEAEEWRWSSLWRREHGDAEAKSLLADWPVERPPDYLRWVDQPLTERELASVRLCVRRGRPFGHDRWQAQTARHLGLEHTLRSRGRPRKKDAGRKLA